MIVFISGTGTNVGKTYVNMELNALLMSRKYNIISIKPIETGINADSCDLDCHDLTMLSLAMTENCAKSRHCEATKSPKQSITDAYLHTQNQSAPKNINEICFYRFSLPAAPFVADSQNIIDIDFLKNKIKALEKECDILLVEGAGGLFVPIKRNYFFIDLINDLGSESRESKLLCLLISHDKLGCIDMILSHREALARRNIAFISIVNLFDKSQFMQVSYPFLRDLKRNFIFPSQKREILEFIVHFMKS